VTVYSRSRYPAVSSALPFAMALMATDWGASRLAKPSGKAVWAIVAQASG